MLSSAVLMSLVLSFVLCLRSVFSVLPLCVVQSQTRQQSAEQPMKTPQSLWCSKWTLFKLDEHIHLRDSNQPFTDCLSSRSCLRSQSASERTMVSWGSEEEEASPLLEVITPEERGVRGIKVSASILRSCRVETNSFLVTLEHLSEYILFVHWSTNTPLRGTSSPPLPPPSVPFPTPPSAFPAPVGTFPVTMATDTRKTEPQLKILWRCVRFSKKNWDARTDWKRRHWKTFYVWKSEIRLLLYAS